MKMGYAPRKITGKHGKSLKHYIELYKAINPENGHVIKSRMQKAINSYKRQKPE